MEAYNVWENKHQLSHSWTLWYLDNNKTKIWEECLVEVGSFNTFEDFWWILPILHSEGDLTAVDSTILSLFNYIKPVSSMKSGSDYSLFKKGIRPMWEDKANREGGRWVVNLDKKLVSPQKMDQYWLEIMDLKMNTLVFAKLKGLPFCSGIVYPPPAELQKSALAGKLGYHCIRFLGSRRLEWVEET